MARTRKFTRDEVLAKAVPVFWQHGYSGTSVQALEKATGVNKSGLYAEFADKADLFAAALEHYQRHRNGRTLLAAEPLGWANIRAFLVEAPLGVAAQRGCFSVNCLRELPDLPAAVQDLIATNRASLRDLLLANIAAEPATLPPEVAVDLVGTLFSGLCIEANLGADAAALAARVDSLLGLLAPATLRGK